jgi:hypothetical protein
VNDNENISWGLSNNPAVGQFVDKKLASSLGLLTEVSVELIFRMMVLLF